MPANRELPAPPGLRLAQLAGLLPAAQLVGSSSDDDPLIRAVTLDSRRVQADTLYAALPGAHTHGARFAVQAAAAGAAAVLTDAAGADLVHEAGVQLPVLVVADPRAQLGAVSAAVYGHPADRLLIFGVTGTNGKTTTTYLLHNVLSALGHRAGLIGTIETRIGADRVRSIRTTPESPDLQELFAQMVTGGADSCAMEISSHALALHRVAAVVVDIAGFTNLSQDHLDFHGTLEEYFRTKQTLFTPEHSSCGVVCVDDDWGVRVAREASVPVTTFRTRPVRAGGDRLPEAQDEAGHGGRAYGDGSDGSPTGAVRANVDADEFEPDWQITRCAPDPDGPGMSVTLTHQAGNQWELISPLPGDFNVANTCLAALMLLRAGFDPEEISASLVGAPGVPGRMQVVSADHPDPSDPLGIVDYAHSPESIATALAALRHSGSGPLVIVLGAGGDRDRGKRRKMGAAAVRGADAVVVTDDNPRSEVPSEIRAEVLAGAREELSHRPGVRLDEVGERAAAVHHALAVLAELTAAERSLDPDASGGTVPGRTGATTPDPRAAHPRRPTLLLAGKGHETGQEIAGTVHPFDDRVVLAQALTHRTGPTPSERTS